MTRNCRHDGPAGGWGVVVASEAIAGAVGFLVLLHMARVLGPRSFASVEFAGVVAGLMLVWVRGGVESIVHREAARRPSLIGPLSEALAVVKIGLAAAGLLAIGLFAAIDRSRIPIFIAGGLILVPSALSMDVGPRALGQFRVLAVIQIARVFALAAATWLLVSRPDDAPVAAGCAVAAEAVAALLFGSLHVARHGWPRLRLRWRAARVVASRGVVASLGRFGRVLLYAADLLILGTLWPGDELGPYAAGRRVVFAIVAVALAVPAAVAPPLASAWARGCDKFRDQLSIATASLLGPVLAASVGLALTARGWMALLFGDEYTRGAESLALIAARLPLLILAVMAGAALVAIRREHESAQVVGLSCVLAMIVVPLSAWRFGTIGAAWGMLAVEGLAACSGWLMLKRFGASPSRALIDPADLAGVAAMSCVVIASREMPVWATSALGATTFGLVRRIGIGSVPSRSLIPSETIR